MTIHVQRRETPPGMLKKPFLFAEMKKKVLLCKKLETINVMKNNIKILIVSCLIGIFADGAKAQSSLVTYSPSSSTLIGGSSRIGYHYYDYFTFYMRYNDSSYLCSELDAALWSPLPTAGKVHLDQDLVITDFSSIYGRQCFIGSYQGVGMYGWQDLSNLNLRE